MLYTRPRQERRACEHLERQGVEVVLPTLQIKRKRQGQVVQVIEPLFPRYLFARIPDGLAWTTVRSTRGVVDFVRFGGVPATIDHDLIVAMAEKAGDRKLTEQLSDLPKTGDKVSLKVGKYAGIEALVAETDGERRCLLLIELLGRQWKVRAELKDVEPLE